MMWIAELQCGHVAICDTRETFYNCARCAHLSVPAWQPYGWWENSQNFQYRDLRGYDARNANLTPMR